MSGRPSVGGINGTDDTVTGRKVLLLYHFLNYVIMKFSTISSFYNRLELGGQLDGNFLPGSLPHKFILILTLIICFVVNKFLSLALPQYALRADGARKSPVAIFSPSPMQSYAMSDRAVDTVANDCIRRNPRPALQLSYK